MNLNAALAKSLLMAASIGMVVPVLADTTVVKTSTDSTTPPPATTVPPQPTPTAPATTKPVTVKPAASKTTAVKPVTTKPAPAGSAAASAAAKKKNAAEIELPGIVQPRANGGFLTVEVEGGKYKISFFDKDKKEMPADIARATARWDTNKKIHQDRTVLNLSEDGKTLRGIEFVSPPYTFKLFLTLLDSEGKAVENYVIQMHP